VYGVVARRDDDRDRRMVGRKSVDAMDSEGTNERWCICEAEIDNGR
jgi:hypothetical protein